MNSNLETNSTAAYFLVIYFTKHKSPRLAVDGLGSTSRVFQERRCSQYREQGERSWVVAVQSPTPEFDFKKAVSA